MAWTTPRDWSTGEFVTEAMMDTHVRDNLNVVPHLLARKTADETVNNNTTLQNDDHLLFAIGASEVWFFEGWLMADGAANADLKIAFTIPSGTLRWAFLRSADTSNASWEAFNAVGGTPVALVGSAVSQSVALNGAGTAFGIALSGFAINGVSAGNVQMQWAQVTAQASDTIIRTQSFLMGFKLA